jgi:hypothetical protein
MAWDNSRKEPEDIMVPSGALSWTEECKHYEDSSEMPEEIKKHVQPPTY